MLTDTTGVNPGSRRCLGNYVLTVNFYLEVIAQGRNADSAFQHMGCLVWNNSKLPQATSRDWVKGFFNQITSHEKLPLGTLTMEMDTIECNSRNNQAIALWYFINSSLFLEAS